MKLKTISVGKEMKVGLPNYSNITAHCELTFDVSEDENPDWNRIWDTVNQQLGIQSSNIDPSWISTKEYTNFFKVTAKLPKEEK